MPRVNVEIPRATIQDENKDEALANIKEAIELVLEVQCEELQIKTPAIMLKITKVEVAEIA
jgi:predicted RNase H-like HicB family nuclease